MPAADYSQSRPYQTMHFYRMRLLLVACILVISTRQGGSCLTLPSLICAGYLLHDLQRLWQLNRGRIQVPALIYSHDPADQRQHHDLLKLVKGIAIGTLIVGVIMMSMVQQEHSNMFLLAMMVLLFNGLAWQLVNWGREVNRMITGYRAQRAAAPWHASLPLLSLPQYTAFNPVATPTAQPTQPTAQPQPLRRS